MTLQIARSVVDGPPYTYAQAFRHSTIQEIAVGPLSDATIAGWTPAEFLS